MCSAAAVGAGGGAAGAGGPVALRVLLLWLQRAQAQAWREGVRCVSFVLLVGAVGLLFGVCAERRRGVQNGRGWGGGCVQFGRAAAVLLMGCADRPRCGCFAGCCVQYGRRADGLRGVSVHNVRGSGFGVCNSAAFSAGVVVVFCLTFSVLFLALVFGGGEKRVFFDFGLFAFCRCFVLSII